MKQKNKLRDMPVRPLLYTMAVPLMFSLLIQSLYNIVDSIFVAKLSETALTAASLVYAIQFYELLNNEPMKEEQTEFMENLILGLKEV